MEEKKQWFFRAHVADRAGALTSIASSFSNEGININTVSGHGSEETGVAGGTIMIAFSCTEEKKDALLRKLKRLSKVTDVEGHPYNKHSLFKSAIVKSDRKIDPSEVRIKNETVLFEEFPSAGTEHNYFIAGVSFAVDMVLDRCRKDNSVKDIMISVIGF